MVPTNATKLHVLTCPGRSVADNVSGNNLHCFPAKSSRYEAVMAAFGRVELTGLVLQFTNTSTVTSTVASVVVVEENGVKQQE